MGEPRICVKKFVLMTSEGGIKKHFRGKHGDTVFPDNVGIS
jgi:hypothetical protein